MRIEDMKSEKRHKTESLMHVRYTCTNIELTKKIYMKSNKNVKRRAKSENEKKKTKIGMRSYENVELSWFV